MTAAANGNTSSWSNPKRPETSRLLDHPAKQCFAPSPHRDTFNILQTFFVEACNWQQLIEIDDSAFEKYPDIAAEAMTLAIERINNNEAENLMEEFANEMFEVGPEMSA